MARKHRYFVPGVTAHIIKRGNNRSAVFSRSDDYHQFLALLRDAAARCATAVHAFALMTNHVHVIATPEEPASIPSMMKELGERYSQYFNAAYLRSGTPWDGRYRAFLLLDERYWLTCLRYVELNPLRAGMVTRAEDYEWSTYSAHAFGRHLDWLEPHPLFVALGASEAERAAAYRRLCSATIHDDEVRRLRAHPAVVQPSAPYRGQTPGSDPSADRAVDLTVCG
jgi:putative transposase